MVSLWEALGKAKEYRWVDLTHELENDSPYWSGIPSGSVELGKQVMDYAEMGFEIQTFKFPGQFGTHIDYPAHFVPGARRAAAFGLKETVLPLVVLDVSQKAASDRDYELTVQDVLEFEERYGRIPKGCFVALRTDWSKGWPSMEKLCGLDGEGNEHFPAWGYEALRFLYEERGIAANGHETLDTDAPVSSWVRGLRCERYVLERDAFQVEAMCNLDQVPPVGAVIVVAAPRIACANGLPVRACAVCPD